MEPMRWEASFIAMSTALGEPLDEVTEAIGDDGAAHAVELVRGLRSKNRSTRATSMAAVLAVVAAELDRMAPT
jgi:hypothetical protein